MKKLKILIAAIVLTSFSANFAFGQNQTAVKDSIGINETLSLEGLRKAEEGDLDPSQQMMIDASTPIYTTDGKKVNGMEMMEFMTSGNFLPEPYINEKNEIKAFVLRPTTEEEKILMQEMKAGMEDKSDLIGKDAIPFSVIDLERNKYSLEDLKGKVIVMNFWFVECKPCIMEIPELNEIVEEYKEEDVVFIGFATNDKSKLKSFLEKTEFDYNIIPGSMDVINSYGINSFPTHIIIDQNSKITYLTSGLGPTTIRDLEQEIKKLLDQ